MYVYIYIWDIYMIYSCFLITQRSHPKKNRGPVFQRRQRNMLPIDACMCVYIYIYIPAPTTISPKKHVQADSKIQKKTHNKTKKTPQIGISEQLGICLTPEKNLFKSQNQTLPNQTYHIRQKTLAPLNFKRPFLFFRQFRLQAGQVLGKWSDELVEI